VAFGIGTNYAIGERMDPQDFREQPEYEYNADLGYSEPIRKRHPLDDDIDSAMEAGADDE
jgi:hypothetical protein